MNALHDLAFAERLRAEPPAVVCLGLTAWDQTWQVEQLPAGGGKMRASTYRDGGGGMAATAAVAVARLGGRAHFWGRAGLDTAGRAMREELAACGVDVQSMRLFDGARSSVSGIVVDARGERSIINFRGEHLPSDAAWLPLDSLHRLSDIGVVLADPRWPEGAQTAFRAARAAGIPTVLDGDVADPEVFDALLPWVDFAVFSEPGLSGYAQRQRTDEDRLRFALQRGCRLAAVTLGERGVLWCDGTALQRQPAFAIEAVDTTGAGDVFHGALALALACSANIAQAMRFAAAAAALKCQRPGGREGIPELATVLALLTHSSKEN
jgi:sulfofructose kinase